MTSPPQGPTASQLHERTLTEEEPRTTKPGGLDVPAHEPSSSANACQHDWKRIEGINGLDWQCSLCLEFSY
jgi:hypothetical protein